MRKILTSIILIVTFASNASSQEENFIAASIYNFTRNIEWPDNTKGGDFIIGVIGHKSVYDKLKEITEGRKMENQNFLIRYFDTTKSITQSHILFVGFWQSKDLQSICEKTSSAQTLIISEKDGMIESGAAINFVVRNGVIKFEIKRSNIEKRKLIVGNALVNLAYKTY